MTSPDNKTKPMCIPCLEGKQTQNEIPRQSNVMHPRVLHCIYSDLCGPMQTRSHQGKFYFLTFIDGNTHQVKVKLLVTKSETCQTIIALIEQAEVKTRECVNFFCSNGGGEYGSNELAAYFESKGIHHEKTNAYTPQENGIAERMNGTIVKMARTLLSEANISIMYWCFAVIYAVYIINRSHTCTLESKTPFKAYTGNKPSIAHLQIFGCKAYVHVLQEKHQKLDKKTLECIYLGYSEHKKAFVLLHHLSGCIIKSRDMHFDKSKSIEPN